MCVYIRVREAHSYREGTMRNLQSYVRADLNTTRFAVVAIWPQNVNEAVILFRERGKPQEMKPWSVQWRGNGHYFQTINEALAYCDSRGFKQEVPM